MKSIRRPRNLGTDVFFDACFELCGLAFGAEFGCGALEVEFKHVSCFQQNVVLELEPCVRAVHGFIKVVLGPF